MAKKQTNLKLIPFTKKERARGEARMKNTLTAKDATTVQLKKDIDAKAKKGKDGKFSYAKLADVKLGIYITSYLFAAQNAVQLSQPKNDSEDSLHINATEARLGEDRFNGFKRSTMAEDIVMLNNIRKNAKAHKKTAVLKATNIKYIIIGLFMCSYVQTGFFSDEILGVHNMPLHKIN